MRQYDGPRYRVAVKNDFMMGTAVTFALDYGGDEIKILHFEGGTDRWDSVNRLVVDKPSLRIPEEFARALYEELARYFNGTSESATARADLLHERSRVDKCLESLIKIAEE